MSVGFNTWQKSRSTIFVVKNIASGGKRVRIFQYPIGNGKERNLMDIPFVSEADIRNSLLKGELYTKLICKEIEITQSNINLVQFDCDHKNFLQAAGVSLGLERIAASAVFGGDYLFRQSVSLIGPQNDANVVFMIPFGEKFLDGIFEGNLFHIKISVNGRELVEGDDFITLESVEGLGYDMVQFESFVPNEKDQIIVDYVVQNIYV